MGIWIARFTDPIVLPPIGESEKSKPHRVKFSLPIFIATTYLILPQVLRLGSRQLGDGGSLPPHASGVRDDATRGVRAGGKFGSR